MTEIRKIALLLGIAALMTSCEQDSKTEQTVDLKCPDGQHQEGNSCVPNATGCPDGQHKEGNSCVPNTTGCPDGQHKEGNSCVPNTTGCPDGQHQEGNSCVPNAESALKCDAAACAQKGGNCSQGVCVTPEMLAVENESLCNVETFVDFCKGDVAVYCDFGWVPIGDACDEGCVVYHETFFGAPKWKAGCIDGGSCTVLNEIQTECVVVNKIPTVFVKACQQTAEKGLQWVSVNGYRCGVSCDAEGKKCALADDECDPYDLSNYSCDRQTLHTCYLSAEKYGWKRSEYCEDKCVVYGNIPTCGYACSQLGEGTQKCVHADSMTDWDSGDFVCKRMDSGELYSIWTKDYDLCEKTCEISTGECQE